MTIKQTIQVFLAAVFMIQATNTFFVVLSFKFNQSYLEKHVCVNRNKPGSKCHARCQLKKQLAEEEQKEKQLPLKLKGEKEWGGYDNNYRLCFNQAIKAITGYPPYKQTMYIRNLIDTIFQPPELGEPTQILL